MKCVYCGYKNEWGCKGEEGEFFRLSNRIKMEQNDNYDVNETDLYGCPKCKKVFIS